MIHSFFGPGLALARKGSSKLQTSDLLKSYALFRDAPD
jgi:hypothetical protein